MQIFVFTFSKLLQILFIFFPLFILAQEPKKDTLQDSTKVREKLKIDGLRVGFDVVQPAITFLDKDIFQLEANSELIFNNKYFLCFDIGMAQIKRFGENYENKGTYFRIGADYNFWHEDLKKTGGILAMGLRYAFANFQHQLAYEIENPYWNTPTSGEISEKNLRVHWIELNFTMKARLFKNLVMGPVVHWAFRLNQPNSILPVNDIPGFGIFNGTRINVGYQFLYQIGW